MSEPNPCLTQMCIEILKNGGTLSDLPKEKTPTLSDVLNLNLGKMKKPNNNTIPNNFNYKKYLYNKKIYYTFTIST